MISVIMISYLGDYPGSRKNPEQKFLRAVDSFINQTIGSENSELVIVSDGCELTNRLYDKHYNSQSNIILIKQPKARSGIFPGSYRQVGINQAKFNYITYLDSDDFLMEYRLERAYNKIKDSDRVIVLDNVYNIPDVRDSYGNIKFGRFIEEIKINDKTFIKVKVNWISSTFQMIHNKETGVYWKDGPRGEDFIFADSLYRKHKINPKNIGEEIGGYVVCHHPKYGFDI